MRDKSEADLRKRINELVESLPPALIYNLLSEIEGMDDEPPERVRLVRQYVVEYLNRQRTNRARRLFTTLFEPFLVDDEVLYHADPPVPGLVQRIDVGALWETLARDAFPLLAVEAQERLDQAASSELLDRVLRSNEADQLRERMRLHALRHLNEVLTSRKALDALLTTLSRHRPRRTKLLSAALDKAPPVTADSIALLRDILANTPGVADELAEHLAGMPTVRASEWQRERQAEALVATAAGVRERVADGDRVAALLPLSVLHVKRNYGVAALYIRHAVADPGRGDPMVTALGAHFVGACRALGANVTGILKLNERVPGSPIRPSVKDKARLDGLMQRIAELLEALIDAGLMADRRTEATYRLAWEAVAKLLAARVGAVAQERASVAASSRRGPSPDQADTVWLARFLWTWYGMANSFGLETFELHHWRETLLEEMRANLEKALKFGEDEALDGRMEHLLRINALCKVFGQRIGAWIPTASHNMTRLVTHRLEVGAVTTADERELIDDVVGAARLELKKSRYWKSDALLDMVELSERSDGKG